MIKRVILGGYTNTIISIVIKIIFVSYLGLLNLTYLILTIIQIIFSILACLTVEDFENLLKKYTNNKLPEESLYIILM